MEIDPEFAMAFRSMAASYGSLYLLSEREKCLQKALELTDRLSDKESYLIQGDFYRSSEKTYDKAIEAYKTLLELYPDNNPGNHNLGHLYRSLEEWDKAIERFEVCRKNRTEFIGSYTILASVYRAKGLYEKAKEILEDHINNISDHDAIRRSLATNYYEQGELDLALAEIDKAFILNPTHSSNLRAKGDIYLYKGDVIKAEEEYQKLLKASEPIAQAAGFNRLGYLYLLQGRFEKVISLWKQTVKLAEKFGQEEWTAPIRQSLGEIYLISGKPKEALKVLDMAWNLAEEKGYLSLQIEALYLKGIIFTAMKSMDEAQESANELKELSQKGMNKKQMRFYYNLMGSIELEKGDFSKAIKYFKDALSLLSYGPLTWRADFIGSLALAYYKAGDLESARQEYKRITSLTTGRRSHGDVYAKSFYILGKIYEQQGDKAKAIDNYKKIFDLRKDADPGLPEVEDAKKRLAGLEGEER